MCGFAYVWVWAAAGMGKRKRREERGELLLWVACWVSLDGLLASYALGRGRGIGRGRRLDSLGALHGWTGRGGPAAAAAFGWVGGLPPLPSYSIHTVMCLRLLYGRWVGGCVSLSPSLPPPFRSFYQTLWPLAAAAAWIGEREEEEEEDSAGEQEEEEERCSLLVEEKDLYIPHRLGRGS